ncbi:Xaa-Pro peptidase family protein (plasmid) [Halorussus salilacus]|uniref:M24 family metallopeptidase n=1 Tax=Halorussus salilacus TaxID=2953750 RepID=UPI00209DC7EC|nr:Xaa-Pro peptidase family protein [Halorussus salilacus]USZ69942.1 Xaa-Pro peptidase family protein [Halorussus salilacus]
MNVFEERTRRCRDRLAEVGADAAVLFPSTNLFYASGFREEPMERHLFLFVPRDGDPVFVAPEMYDEQIRDASWVEDLRLWADGEDPGGLVADLADEMDLRGGRLLVDDTMWALFTQDLRETLPDATFGLASEVFDDLRVRKDEAELDALREAGALADEVSVAARELGEDAVGMTETELADEIDRLLSARGGEGLSFETVVGSGPNGAKPHHRHGDREIERGDPVVLDFGASVGGYPGDQTRTVVFAGDPPEGYEEVHETVLEAQRAAVQAVEPGVPAAEIDRAAREVIESAGYGEQFTHRTGHGVGLDVHEHPYIVEGNETELEPGMVFSVEPGVYLPGEFGVRIEDLVVVTDEGFERLNDSPRAWEPL